MPPWLKKDPSFSLLRARDDLSLLHHRYHQEMLSFVKWAEIDPHSLEMQDRQELFTRIKYQINKVFPEAELSMFGSTASGFALKGSDVDMVVLYSKVKHCELCEKIHERL